MSPTCLDCHHPLRAHSAPYDEATRRHEGHGLCTGCYRRRQRDGTLPERKSVQGDTVIGPCGRCGRVRSYKPARANSQVCQSCRQVLDHPEPITEEDELLDGRWVPERGVMVWRESVSA